MSAEQCAVGRRQKATVMKLLRFSFKAEAIWMLVFGFAPAVVGLLIVLVVFVARLWR